MLCGTVVIEDPIHRHRPSPHSSVTPQFGAPSTSPGSLVFESGIHLGPTPTDRRAGQSEPRSTSSRLPIRRKRIRRQPVARPRACGLRGRRECAPDGNSSNRCSRPDRSRRCLARDRREQPRERLQEETRMPRSTSCPHNALPLSCERPSAADRQLQRLVRRRYRQRRLHLLTLAAWTAVE